MKITFFALAIGQARRQRADDDGVIAGQDHVDQQNLHEGGKSRRRADVRDR